MSDPIDRIPSFKLRRELRTALAEVAGLRAELDTAQAENDRVGVMYRAAHQSAQLNEIAASDASREIVLLQSHLAEARRTLDERDFDYRVMTRQTDNDVSQMWAPIRSGPLALAAVEHDIADAAPYCREVWIERRPAAGEWSRLSSPDTETSSEHVPTATAEWSTPGYSAACSCGYESGQIYPTEAEAIEVARAHAASGSGSGEARRD